METVKIRVANKQGYAECEIGGVLDYSYPSSKTRRGRVQGNGQISPTIPSEMMGIGKLEKGGKETMSQEYEYRIRKLTPRECFRLMDMKDEDFDKAAAVNSNTQLYKEAGNSIVVNVLVAILGQLFEGKENVYKEILEKERPYD